MQDMIAVYKKHFNLKDATFSRIDHADAIVAIVYTVKKINGEIYILKICQRESDYHCEYYFLNYFADKIPVPKIIDAVAPEADVHGAILMEYLHGDLLQQSHLTLPLNHETGSLLAQIHLHKAAGYGDLTKPHALSQESTAFFTFKFAEGMAECSNHLPQALLNACWEFYNAHIDYLKTADGPYIIHRDFRPGNVIVSNDKIQGIIDWSSAKGGFAEEDFTALVLGDWSKNKDLKNSFLAGYKTVRPIPDYLRVVPLLLLSKAIATIGYAVKTETWHGKNAALYQKHRKFLDDFLN